MVAEGDVPREFMPQLSSAVNWYQTIRSEADTTAAPDADSPGSNIAWKTVASEKSGCSVARQNSQAETIRRRHPWNHPPGQSTGGSQQGAVNRGQSTGGGSLWGTHSGCGAALPRGHSLQRGWQDGLGLQAGPSIGDTQRGHTTETGNEEGTQPTATATKWRLLTGGPGKRGRTTGTSNQGHNSRGDTS